MATVTKPHGDFVNNVDVANATYVDDQFNTLYNLVNGGLDGTNVPNLGDMTTVPTTAKKVADAITEIWNYPFSSVTRQAIINPSFSVNQRVVSGTVTLAAGAYGHDRWKAGAAGCTYTFTTVNNVTTITITAGSLIQVIEGVNLFSGTYTLSWTGTAQGKIGTGAFGASGITGAATGGTNLSIEFNTGTLSKVQFNVGSIALPFQPRSFAEELALCQRYYEKSYLYSDIPATTTVTGAFNFAAGVAIAGSASGTLPTSSASMFKVRKRVTPTMQFYNYISGVTGSIRNTTAGTDRTGITAFTPSETGVYGLSVDATSANAISAGQVIAFHWTADSEI